MSSWAPHWQIVELGEFATFRNGINFGDANRGRGIKLVGVSNFRDNFLVPYDDLDEINPLGVIREDDLLKENDIVFVRSNGNRQLIGRTLFVKDLPGKVTHSGFTIRLRFHSQELYPEFYAQLFRSDMIRDELSQSGSGTNISNLNQQTLGELAVPLPPLPEQRKIAAILSTWDEAITLMERLIEALRQRKQALMQLLLTGEVRFKVFEGKARPEMQLESYIDLLTGFPFSSENFKDVPGVKLLRGINITTGSLRWEEGHTKYWDSIDAKLEKYSLRENDIVIGMDGSLVGHNFAWLSRNDLPSLLVQRVARLRSKSGLNQNYLFQYIGSPFFTRYVDSVRTVTAIPHISPADIKDFTINLPSEAEQTRIAEVLHSCDDELNICISMGIQLQIQKRGLMQQLLTGAIRVQLEE